MERGFQTQLVRSLRGQGSGHARDVAGSTLWRTLWRTLWHTLRRTLWRTLWQAVLSRVLLCCRQPALKVLQLALKVLLLALKVLYERLKVWGRGATRARHPPPRP